MRLELLDVPPEPVPKTTIVLAATDTAWGVIRDIEKETGYVYDLPTRRFVQGVATHPLDAPDAAGRPSSQQPLAQSQRGIVRFSVAFARSNAALSPENLFLAIQWQELQSAIPAGVQATWSIQNERSYTESSLSTDTGVSLATTRKTVPAGLSYSGMSARLPGARCRVVGTLSMSAFSGVGVDRATINIPIDIDAERSTWVQVMQFRAANLDLSVIFKSFGVSIGTGAEWASVWVRID